MPRDSRSIVAAFEGVTTESDETRRDSIFLPHAEAVFSSFHWAAFSGVVCGWPCVYTSISPPSLVHVTHSYDLPEEIITRAAAVRASATDSPSESRLILINTGGVCVPDSGGLICVLLSRRLIAALAELLFRFIGRLNRRFERNTWLTFDTTCLRVTWFFDVSCARSSPIPRFCDSQSTCQAKLYRLLSIKSLYNFENSLQSQMEGQMSETYYRMRRVYLSFLSPHLVYLYVGTITNGVHIQVYQKV